LTKHEYEELLRKFPVAQPIIAPLREEREEIVTVNIDGLTAEQKAQLDATVYEELRRHLHKWYVIHTYSGFEKIVKENLEQRIKSLGFSARVSEVLIPTEDIMEVKEGKKQVSTKRSFPGYVFVKMEVNDDVWYAIRNTPKVSGFVGGAKPSPLLDAEVDAILKQMKETSERPQPKVLFETGETVRIIDGPFSNFTGIVDTVSPEHGKLKVMVTIFGRSTPVELEFGQVEKGES
jgi:transcriptional antiterminator NusG